MISYEYWGGEYIRMKKRKQESMKQNLYEEEDERAQHNIKIIPS
jgi:hypothetical protein